MRGNDRSSGLINGKRMRGRTKLLGTGFRDIAHIVRYCSPETDKSGTIFHPGQIKNLPFAGIDIYRVSLQRGAGHRPHKYLISAKKWG